MVTGDGGREVTRQDILAAFGVSEEDLAALDPDGSYARARAAADADREAFFRDMANRLRATGFVVWDRFPPGATGIRKDEEGRYRAIYPPDLFLAMRYGEAEATALNAAETDRDLWVNVDAQVVPSDLVVSMDTLDHLYRQSPSRTVASMRALRAVVDLHYDGAQGAYGPDAHFCAACTSGEGLDDPGWPCPTLLALLGAYTAHPEFDPSWRR